MDEVADHLQEPGWIAQGTNPQIDPLPLLCTFPALLTALTVSGAWWHGIFLSVGGDGPWNRTLEIAWGELEEAPETREDLGGGLM